jgi:hypothetical protein
MSRTLGCFARPPPTQIIKTNYGGSKPGWSLKENDKMDRDEMAEKRARSGYANTAEVNDADSALLNGVTGREDNLGADPASDSQLDINQPIGAQPRSQITAYHEPGTGAQETEDGLSETEELLRRAVEDETEADDFEDLPVFDRADAIPKIL